jgi:hypothetical protein
MTTNTKINVFVNNLELVKKEIIDLQKKNKENEKLLLDKQNLYNALLKEFKNKKYIIDYSKVAYDDMIYIFTIAVFINLYIYFNFNFIYKNKFTDKKKKNESILLIYLIVVNIIIISLLIYIIKNIYKVILYTIPNFAFSYEYRIFIE